MTHQQILDKLAAKHLVKSIDDDLARLTFSAMCYQKDMVSQLDYLLPKLLNRWNCALNAVEVSNNYKQITILALSVLLHKYGFKDETISKRAIAAVDLLNKEVVLSDDFFRKSEEIKQFILSSPTPLKRKPSVPENITFYRQGDVISIELENHYYAAYIHEISDTNESPLLEFYDHVFDKVPTLRELENLPAKGQLFDGVMRIAKFSVHGIKYNPDLANQIQLIAACVKNPPSVKHLKKAIVYTISDLFKIQNTIKSLFPIEKS
ncbi:hypothetical protein [Flavobacterium sp. Root901]|uniref:hypothetical protein n=1 Tax=Flavobacterium sp. Root901 TaxID=1736605 RepID=UPI000B05512C|nr:hypothetical protein [Flavobacterium sp. Root901]